MIFLSFFLFIVVCGTQGLELNIVHLLKHFLIPYIELTGLQCKKRSHVLRVHVQILTSGLVD